MLRTTGNAQGQDAGASISAFPSPSAAGNLWLLGLLGPGKGPCICSVDVDYRVISATFKTAPTFLKAYLLYAARGQKHSQRACRVWSETRPKDSADLRLLIPRPRDATSSACNGQQQYTKSINASRSKHTWPMGPYFLDTFGATPCVHS